MKGGQDSDDERPGVSFVHGRDRRTLSRRGFHDEASYNRKAREAAIEHLPLLIRQGAVEIEGSGDRRTLRIPLSWLELPKLRYGDNRPRPQPSAGDDLEMPSGGRSGQPQHAEGTEGAGNQPGDEFYEIELPLYEIQKEVFKDLGLPFLEPKGGLLLRATKLSCDDVRKKRSPSRLDINRTALEVMRRTAAESGRANLRGITLEDLRCRVWTEKLEEEGKSAVIIMRDKSGTMGKSESYIARGLSWWVVNFLEHQYKNVAKVFVVHDFEAQEVSEEKFFARGSSGGTRCSSANDVALRVVKERFPTDEYNIYVMHFSDGDNFPRGLDDNSRCVRLVEEMLEAGISQYAYVQIRGSGGLLWAYNEAIDDPRFVSARVVKQQDVVAAVRKMFDPTKELVT